MVFPMQNVVSSNLQAVGYDSSSLILTVDFIGGGSYEYYGVPLSVYQGLMNADSKGTYLSRYIKGVYKYRKIR
jgi:hypothetical protein